MNYLIIGTILALTGVGLMMQKNTLLGLLGIIVFIMGGYLGLKGRRELDKK